MVVGSPYWKITSSSAARSKICTQISAGKRSMNYGGSWKTLVLNGGRVVCLFEWVATWQWKWSWPCSTSIIRVTCRLIIDHPRARVRHPHDELRASSYWAWTWTHFHLDWLWLLVLHFSGCCSKLLTLCQYYECLRDESEVCPYCRIISGTSSTILAMLFIYSSGSNRRSSIWIQGLGTWAYSFFV